MTGHLRTMLAAAWLLATLTAVADTPAERYGRLPTIGDARLSPSGTQLLTLVALEGAYQVGLRDLATGEARILLSTDGVEFRYQWCEFASETRVVCSLRKPDELVAGGASPVLRYRERRVIREHLVAVDTDGSDVLQLVPRAVTRAGEDLVWNPPDQDEVIAWLPDDPDHVLIQLAREDRVWPTVYRLNLRTNRLREVRAHRAGVLRWIATPDGTLRAGLGYRGLQPVAFAVRGNRLEEIPLEREENRVDPPRAFTTERDAPLLWLLASRDAPWVGLHAFDLEAGSFTEDGTTLDGTDMTALFVDPRTGAPRGVQIEDPHPRTLWLDPALGTALDAVAAAFPGDGVRVRLVDTDAAERRMLVSVDAPTTGPALYLFEPEGGRLARIAPGWPEVETVFENQPFEWTARDGLALSGWLTLPGPEADGPYPTVLLPHGGPWAHDSGGFDYWAQFLASRGLAVLQPNFRGSTGRGTTFLAAGFEQWGRAMQDDVFDGLDALVETGIADPERVCVMGGSYGGYAALVASYRDAERIRCAVSFAGVSDLDDLDEDWRAFRLGALSTARLQSGPLREAASPLRNASRVRVPLLVVHGVEDRVVKVEHSRTLVAALEQAEVPVTYVEQPHGDHYLSRESDRIEFLEAVDTLLTESLSLETLNMSEGKEK